MVLTETAIDLDLLWHGIHNVDPNTKRDRKNEG